MSGGMCREGCVGGDVSGGMCRRDVLGGMCRGGGCVGRGDV